MTRSPGCLLLLLLVRSAFGEVLFQEDFEDADLKSRGWYDIRGMAGDGGLAIVGAPEVTPRSGDKCLRIFYPTNGTGGWMHHNFKASKEVYCRYYRLFPEGWEWPKGYGPHDTLFFAGDYDTPTGTDLSIYLDFWKTGDTMVRVATAFQQWGYGGFGDVLRKKTGTPNRLANKVAKPDVIELGKWHCVEYCARLSDPGKENGILKLWVNGKLCGEAHNIPLVDEKHAGILFNYWMLGPYFHGGSLKDQCCYMDSLVVATEYIGTLEQKGNQPPRARLDYTRDWGSSTARFDASRSADPDGQVAKYAWEFGDGTQAEGKTVAHPYASAGEYSVVLTVTDDKGETNSDRIAIEVGPEVGSGIGLKGEYHDGESLAGEPVATYLEPRIFFQRQGWDTRYLCWEAGDKEGDHYSCRWTGFLQPTRSEEYILTLEVNDGGCVWFDGKLVLDGWDPAQLVAIDRRNGVKGKTASVGLLQAGKKYPIRIEHYKGTFKATGAWRAKLYWETPTIEREPVPGSQLYPPEGFLKP